VQVAQGYPRRAVASLAPVVATFDRPRPSEVDELQWNEAHVRALNTLVNAQVPTFAFEAAAKNGDRALQITQTMLDHEDVRLAHRKLAVHTTLGAARAHFRNGDKTRAQSLAETGLANAKLLLGQAPSDLTLRSLHVFATRSLGWVLRQSGAYERAEKLLESIQSEAEQLVTLRPDNYYWRRIHMDVLSTLGESRSGKEQAFWLGREEFKQAYAIAELLHAQDPTNARQLYSLITLCDRMAVSAGAAQPPDPVAARGHRRNAAKFARTLSGLEESNVGWRYLLAYTLGTSAGYMERTEALEFLQESRSHTQYALERFPDAHDITDFLGVLAAEELKLIKDPKQRLQIVSATVDYLLRIARDNPDAYWPVQRLRSGLIRLKGVTTQTGADGRAELVRLARLVQDRAAARGANEHDPERKAELQSIQARAAALLAEND
jgi:tetratricopeptide (TPR) repeat protein